MHVWLHMCESWKMIRLFTISSTGPTLRVSSKNIKALSGHTPTSDNALDEVRLMSWLGQQVNEGERGREKRRMR